MSVVRTGGVDVVVVTRYDELAAVERDHRSFGNIGHHPHPDAVAGRPASQRNLSATDLPRQAALRRLYLEALRPGLIAHQVPTISAVVQDRTDRFVAQLEEGRTDLVVKWAVPIPALVIATVLGLPHDDAHMIHQWVESQFSDAPRNPDGTASLGGRAPVDFDAYLHEQIAQRRGAAWVGEDAISRMLNHVGPDGASFSDDEVSFYVRDILMAGNETTTSLLSNFMFRVLEDPTRYARLQREPVLLESAIEESLRFDTPLMQFARIANRSASVGGYPVDAGTVLSLSMPSANRDERRFGPDADRFVIDRYVHHDVNHVTFGVGIHQCVGAHLARVTARIALGDLLGRTLQLRLAPGVIFEKVDFFEFWRSRTVCVELAR